MVTRLEALHSKFPGCDSFWDLGVNVSKLVLLNSNVKALMQAMVFNLKQTHGNTQCQSKIFGAETLATNTPDAETLKTSPSGIMNHIEETRALQSCHKS